MHIIKDVREGVLKFFLANKGIHNIKDCFLFFIAKGFNSFYLFHQKTIKRIYVSQAIFSVPLAMKHKKNRLITGFLVLYSQFNFPVQQILHAFFCKHGINDFDKGILFVFVKLVNQGQFIVFCFFKGFKINWNLDLSQILFGNLIDYQFNVEY